MQNDQMSNVQKINSSNNATNFLFSLGNCLFRGVLGFSIFITAIFLSKLFGSVIGVTESINISSMDLNISLMGFVFLFLTGLLKKLNVEEST